MLESGAVSAPLPFGTRLWFAWVCFFKVLFDGVFAGRVFEARAALPEAPPPKEPDAADTGAKDAEIAKLQKQLEAARKAAEPKADRFEPALQLLALLQREGRLVDFLEEDVAGAADADIGAAARVVHAGCRKALRSHVKLEPIRPEEEGTKVTLAEGFSPSEVKLTGNVEGKGPFTGALRHRGWRAASVTLPEAVAGHDARVVAQAEVEL